MYKIREALPDDIQFIVSFQINMALETENLILDSDILTSGVESVFRFPDKGRYFVACTDREVIASLMITYEWSDWRNRTIFWIQSVYVLPEHRRRGVYASLYQHIRKLAEADTNIGGIRLYVDRTNLTAQATYASLGMNGEHYQVFEWMKESND
jgi:ribosomal protein S18 acetylase RimI-like enzyme